MKTNKNRVAVLREALVEIRSFALACIRGTGGEYASNWQGKILKDCNDALETPLLNCEVGTPREQAERHNRCCHNNDDMKCIEQPNCTACFASWGQRPYKEVVSHAEA